MTRILFVDDEKNILDGLRRMLRGMRDEWSMSFAQSGAEALELLEREPFDVVVSDMRMPGMDGAELLTEVKRRHPESIRIILSGHSERATVLKSVGPTHQYLAKPCDPDLLKTTIRRTYGVRDLLRDEKLQQLVADMKALPSMPDLFRRVVEEVQDPNASLSKVGELIARDMGMSAKVLQLVNSAYFGLPHEMSSVPQAVVYLGLENVTSLVLAVGVFSELDTSRFSGFSVEALFDHSLQTGGMARVISNTEGYEPKLSDDAFLAGMLHDVGKLILAANVPEAYEEVRRRVRSEDRRLRELEQETFGATHAEVGAYLLGLWGLPHTIVEAVAYHSQPAESPLGSQVLTLVHAADVLSRGGAGPDEAFLEQSGVLARWPAWQEACRERVAGASV